MPLACPHIPRYSSGGLPGKTAGTSMSCNQHDSNTIWGSITYHALIELRAIQCELPAPFTVNPLALLAHTGVHMGLAVRVCAPTTRAGLSCGGPAPCKCVESANGMSEIRAGATHCFIVPTFLCARPLPLLTLHCRILGRQWTCLSVTAYIRTIELPVSRLVFVVVLLVAFRILSPLPLTLS